MFRELLKLLSFFLVSCQLTPKEALKDRAKAQELVAAYSKSEKVFDDKDFVSFGNYDFKYNPSTSTLTARVYVNGATTKEATAQALENYRKMVLVLNDPAIGGMFENGGGYWVLDENIGAYFLAKDFDVNKTDESSFITEVEELEDVHGVWLMEWMSTVARIMHGHREVPTQLQTVREWRKKNP